MSDPMQQRADGCSIFITVFLVIAASVIFLSIHHFLSPEQESSASQIIDEQRKEKISQHAEESKNFAKKVKAGMWSGEFQEPERWRRENRD